MANEESNAQIEDTHDDITPGADESESNHEDVRPVSRQTKGGDTTELENKLKELRRESAKYRTRAKDSEREVSDLKELLEKNLKQVSQLEATINQKLTEVDKKLLEAQDKISLADKRAIHSKLELEAKSAGCVDYEVFSKLVDTSSISISETGEVKGVTEIVKSIKESKPFLFDAKAARITSNVFNIPTPAKETRVDRSAQLKNDRAAYEREKRALINKY